MAIKKSELYSSLWESCDELRGGMDASQYKDYVLVLLFVKYVSDKYASQKDALLDVPKGGSFADMVALKGDKEIGDKINKIIAKLAEANDLKGVIDVADFNDADKLGKGKEMVDRLSNLVGIFDNPALDFRSNRAEGDDLLGDAYEYLMRHFATESGKSKGQFYTPAEVSRVMAKVIGVGSAKSASQTIHDPTCGSGSLLLKAHDEAKSTAGLDLTLYGQEMDNATAALAKMNMILHDCPTAEIWQDNVLSSPHFKERDGRLKTFDFVVANPPFSFKAWSNGFNPANDEYRPLRVWRAAEEERRLRLPAAHPHLAQEHRQSGGNLPHGVLFRGGAEADIRRKSCAGLHQRHHRPAGQSLLRHRHPRLHHCARQGKRRRPQGHLHDRRLQGLHQGRQQEPAARPGYPQDRGHLHPPGRNAALLAHGAAGRDQRPEERLQPQPPALHRQHRAGGPAGHRRPSARRYPGPRHRRAERYWEVFPGVRAALFEKADRPGYCQLKVAVAESRPPSSATRSSPPSMNP